jgi:hypothetical protein
MDCRTVEHLAQQASLCSSWALSRALVVRRVGRRTLWNIQHAAGTRRPAIAVLATFVPLSTLMEIHQLVLRLLGAPSIRRPADALRALHRTAQPSPPTRWHSVRVLASTPAPLPHRRISCAPRHVPSYGVMQACGARARTQGHSRRLPQA